MISRLPDKATMFLFMSSCFSLRFDFEVSYRTYAKYINQRSQQLSQGACGGTQTTDQRPETIKKSNIRNIIEMKVRYE